MSTRRAALSLYRRSLKLALDWAVHRHLWRGQAMYIRSLFEANRNVTDPRHQRALLTETEKLLESWKHPDPYTPPTAPGGMSRQHTGRVVMCRMLMVPLQVPSTSETSRRLFSTLPHTLSTDTKNSTGLFGLYERIYVHRRGYRWARGEDCSMNQMNLVIQVPHQCERG
ncbi:NADH dehydrogenase (ubiquinone) 1 beta subcomplex 9 [Fusarium oxysporum f. sp. conglutinans race 2 54008]|uniref:NADH dehydrogenase [ubiquinone] 1 beta subcomplex subunit 9 n=4 Tax=Fusarium oxysporum TaxID=5507 RepID=X0H5K0_FUSOX|nr:NADH dehydrogenase (ubiquinone) 1 beta subcomplex 9 [Fusarium oxysporum f. sp. pisi HDV247]EXL67231.1 NADH dehydrogenase (ubiquinone) 1 beta subcomplex 9 [Fusarium oxysporum f. sp. conglutinans race 2 54008]